MDTDRDIIDLAIPTAEDHLDWVRSIIAHRAPEIGPADIASAYAPTEPDDGAAKARAEVMERVLDAVEALGERLEALERTINGGQDDDDESGDQRQASGRN